MKLLRASDVRRRAQSALSRRIAAHQSSLLRLAQTAARGNFQHLWDAEFRIFSQWGEDGILNFLCESLQIWHPRMLEIGAGDFQECNSRFVAEELAGRVVVVDADSTLVTSVTGRGDAWKSTVIPVCMWVTPDNINDIIQSADSAVGHLDVLSLDIDGNDYWVLEAARLEGLSILVVEYNPLLGSGLPVSIPRNDSFSRYVAHYSSLYYGASLPAMVQLAAGRGFAFVGTNRVGNNAFFVAQHLVRKIPIDLPDPTELDTYTDWPVRDSRSLDGKMNLLTGQARSDAIAHMPLIRVDTLERIQVADAVKASGPS